MEAGSFSAFPLNTGNSQEGGALYPEPGLSKRELLAAMAMQGLLANSARDFSPDGSAKESVAYADALLAALNGGA